jgi:hypothetical protein
LAKLVTPSLAKLVTPSLAKLVTPSLAKLVTPSVKDTGYDIALSLVLSKQHYQNKRNSPEIVLG